MTAMSIRRLAAAVAACAALGLGPTGCSFSYHLGRTPTLGGDEVAREVSTQLAAKYNRAPEKVTCPDLTGEVGTKITCRLTDAGKTYDVAVATTSVVDGKIKFSIEVAGAPATPPTTAPAAPSTVLPAPARESSTSRAGAVTMPGSELEDQVSAKWREQNGRTPYPVICPNLPGVVGRKVTCQLVDGDRNYAVIVTTTSVTGTLVRFSITSRPV